MAKAIQHMPTKKMPPHLMKGTQSEAGYQSAPKKGTKSKAMLLRDSNGKPRTY